MNKTLASVLNPAWKYTNSKETDIRKTFAKHGWRKTKVIKRKTSDYFTEQELADSRAPMIPAPRGWASTDLTPQEWEEAMRLMAQDYAELGNPYQGDNK